MLRTAEHDRRLFGKWMLASGIGYPLGLLVAFPLSYGLVNRVYPKESNLILGLCIGLVVGLLQWRVLRRRADISARWVGASALGMAIPFVLLVLLAELGFGPVRLFAHPMLNDVVALAIPMAFGGLLTGLLQVPLLKPFGDRAPLWIAVSTVAWGISIFGLWLGGVILGVVTGAALRRWFDLPRDGDSPT